MIGYSDEMAAEGCGGEMRMVRECFPEEVMFELSRPAPQPKIWRVFHAEKTATPT